MKLEQILDLNNEIISRFIKKCGLNLNFIGIHGSCLWKEIQAVEDIDVVVVLKVLDCKLLKEIQTLHTQFTKLHLLPYSDSEIKCFPVHNRLQFFQGMINIFGSLDINPPRRKDLIDNLAIRLSDNIIIRSRNAFFDKGRMKYGDFLKFLPVMHKEIFWWWRTWYYIHSGIFMSDPNKLSQYVPCESSRKILLKYREKVYEDEEDEFFLIQSVIPTMIQGLESLKSNTNILEGVI